MNSPRVAYIGLGAMGLPMARNIHKAGFPLSVWNRNLAKSAEFSSDGATVAATPSDAAAAADIIFMCLPAAEEVRDMLAREDGIFAGARNGSIVIDCSTIDPKSSKEMAAQCATRGIDFLEAPLSGGTIGAKNGTLTLMIGGDAAVLERARPVLQVVGKNLFHVGGAGAGQTVKLCNQMIFAAQMVAVAEAFALIDDAGIDPVLATKIFSVSTADCSAVRGRVPVAGVQPDAPASHDYEPGFATKWMAKDLKLVEDLARDSNRAVMQGAVNHQMMRLAMSAGYAEKDLSILGVVLREQIRKRPTS
ncbi:MAG: NAD(P)-dependent oxidoreductase [Candidatus Eremiobacteraeota bacterium]|nr:NAD(P)-dependent oxidoreductase [Candidatus Eremiobacteraeota bacterium]